jgi:rhamnogalacturonyl hydrolase YesR
MRRRLLIAIVLGLVFTSGPARGQEDYNAQVDAALRNVTWPGMLRLPIGVTRRGTLIWCLMDRDALDYRSPKARQLFVGGMQGDRDEVDNLLRHAQRIGQRTNRDYLFAVVPIANPDGWATGRGPGNLDGGHPAAGYPPQPPAYNSPTDPEAMSVWRFIGWYAPDVVYETQTAADPLWERVRNEGLKKADWPGDSLAAAVERELVAGIGTAYASRYPAEWTARLREGDPKIVEYSGLLETPRAQDEEEEKRPPWSELRKNVIARLDRTPQTVATELSAHYGQHLNTVMYQPALALVARLRLAELTEDATHRAEVEKICAPYLTGEPSLPEQANGSLLSGHLVFAELARVTGDARYVDLVRRAADSAFDENGAPREAMPYHLEMSDSVFMGCPILTAAGRLTGEPKYFEMALTHLRFMQGHCVREDGLYRHSPLCEAAWGRGNGFPALGLALSLTDLEETLRSPPDQVPVSQKVLCSAIREEMLAAYRAHLTALLPHQDPTGTWRQVIDHPGSYRELTATSMITFAILRGLKYGWLDSATFEPPARRAWEALKVRIGSDGALFDVCTGTGKQQTLRDYLDREAILGQDERGGAMALMVSVEMADWMAGQ